MIKYILSRALVDFDPKLTRKEGIENLHRSFELSIKNVGLPSPVKEYRFHPTKRWLFDYAWPDIMLAVELETMNANHRIVKFDRFYEKYREALRMGWIVLRFPPSLIESGVACAETKAAFSHQTLNKKKEDP